MSSVKNNKTTNKNLVITDLCFIKEETFIVAKLLHLNDYLVFFVQCNSNEMWMNTTLVRKALYMKD